MFMHLHTHVYNCLFQFFVVLPLNWERPYDEYQEICLSPDSIEFDYVFSSFKNTIGKADEKISILEVV